MTLLRCPRTRASFALALLAAGTASAQSAQPANGEEAIFDALRVRDGITVCEMGAGNGDLTIAAARRIGPRGHVYTSELGDRPIKTLQERVAASGLEQITVVAGDAVRTNFPDAACDALFMRNVYHHFEDPAAMGASIAAALKPGGRAVIVDFPPDREADRPADRDRDGTHGVTPESVVREMTAAGLEPEPAEKTGRSFMVVVSKP